MRVCLLALLTSASLASAAFPVSASYPTTASYSATVTYQGIDSDATALAAAMVSNGGTISATTLQLVSNFCATLKPTPLWNKLLRIQLRCGNQLAGAQVPLKAGMGSALDTWVSVVGGDYVETGSTGGVKGDALAKAVNTTWNPSTMSSLTDIGMWFYGTTGNGNFLLGCHGGGSSDRCYFNPTSFLLAGSNAEPVATLSQSGFCGMTSKGSRLVVAYNSAGTLGSATTSGTFPNLSFFTLARNLSGAGNTFSSAHERGYIISKGLNAAEVAQLYTAWQAFQTGLGRQL